MAIPRLIEHPTMLSLLPDSFASGYGPVALAFATSVASAGIAGLAATYSKGSARRNWFTAGAGLAAGTAICWILGGLASLAISN